MSELIIFPDVEALIVQTLNADTRTAAPWATRVPNPRPAEFGRVMRIGGPKETLVSENAELVLEGWAQTEERSVSVLNLARAILASQDHPLFGYEEQSGPANLPDPTTDAIRYTMNVTIRVRGSILA